MKHDVAVIIATRGRPALVGRLVERLGQQTLRPSHIFVVGSAPEDLVGLEDRAGLTVRVGRAGLPLQRNDGLRLAGGQFDCLVFFDDDFVPSRFWLARAAQVFAGHEDVAGLTGTVLADGAKTPGIAYEAGSAIVEAHDAAPLRGNALDDRFGPYGCNMAFRTVSIQGLLFDERLPLYGWLEDSDFGGQVARRGRTARAECLWGVHLGDKSGRERGRRLGYSQIANPVYLMRKGTVPALSMATLMARNVAANTLGSISPESFVDRPGRLRGNLVAMADLVRGRVTPERAAHL